MAGSAPSKVTVSRHIIFRHALCYTKSKQGSLYSLDTILSLNHACPASVASPHDNQICFFALSAWPTMNGILGQGADCVTSEATVFMPLMPGLLKP